MPTGYTADVADGKITELKPFVLQCARAFGALLPMRDDPCDKPIPEKFEPSDYHSKKLVELRAERDNLLSLSETLASKEAGRAYDEASEAWDKRQRDKAEQRERYAAMIQKVVEYDCPHAELRAFMLEQLQTGMDFDCPPPTDRDWDKPPVAQTGAQWRSERLAKIEQGILYHAAEHAKEVERTESRNIWIATLRASLENVK